MNTNIKIKLLNFVLLFISLLIAFSVGEVFLRLVKPQMYYRELPSGQWLPEKDLCNIDVPNLKSFYETNEFRVDYSTNSLGLRDREFGEKKKGIKRILILGDSFTWGAGVPQDETYPKYLERLLNEKDTQYEVINAGIRSYDTRQEYYFLLKYGLALEPDLVIVGFTPNDITGVDGCIFRVNSDGDLVGIYRKKNIRILRTKGLKVPEPFSLHQFLKMNSHLYVLLHNFWRKLQGDITISTYIHDVYFKDEYRTVKTFQIYEIFLSYLEKIKELCRRNSIKFVLLGIPMMEHVDNTNTKMFAHINLRQPYEVAFRWSRRHGVPFIDPVEDFAKESRNEDLYWKIDRHMNNKGYSLLAHEVYKFLLNNKLL